MKHEGKELYLLLWNGSTGKFDKRILNPALKQNTDGEYHVILGQSVGTL
jgi:hypothetical protein